MFKIEGINFSYGKDDVLKDISFEIQKGEFLGIIGPNGSGKTTLLKVLARILKPYRGKILLENEEIYEIPLSEYAKKVAYLPSMIEFSFSYTVEEFVSLGRFPYTGRYGQLKKSDRDIVENVLEQFEIGQYRKRKVWELSDGEKQRVFIAQVITQQASVIILDEPVSHLDIGHSFKIMDIIKEINRSGITVISVLHELNLASEYCTKLLLLNKGSIFSEGTAEEVITYQNIEKVYQTKVLVYKNPHTGKPYVFGIPAILLTR
ncbi:MAG TPA: ABC transporter ATP-binding protein [bacterium]|nr:ABC transporter ATP-binding protein [bacterium]HPP30661.1 ABC transporter ATP-binding protein [bacterium]